MYLLDTTHCIAFLDGRLNIQQRLDMLGELLFGVFKAEQFIKNLEEVMDFLKDIEVHMIDEETSEIYGKLKNAILDRFGPKDKGKRRNVTVESLGFRDNDVWIASTAIQHGLILVSADSDLLRLNGIEGLKVENW